jgi:hypothetical protein
MRAGAHQAKRNETNIKRIFLLMDFNITKSLRKAKQKFGDMRKKWGPVLDVHVPILPPQV